MDRAESARLDSLRERIRECLRSGGWWTLRELETVVGGHGTGVSAKLRDLRKPRYGGHTIEAERVCAGLWRYRMVPQPRVSVGEQMGLPLA